LEEAQRRGLDLLFALDTSKSMLAPDLKPDRLTRAKLAIRDLVAKFDGDRVGSGGFLPGMHFCSARSRSTGAYSSRPSMRWTPRPSFAAARTWAGP